MSCHRRPGAALVCGLACCALTALTTLPAAAQQQSSRTDNAWNRPADGWSLLPYTRRGYVGLNLGKPEFDVTCGSTAFSCSDPSVGGYLYTGGHFNDWLGLEIGYLYSGKADRAGGDTSAQGLNLSLVLRAPLGRFGVFAKGGAAYTETKVSTAAGVRNIDSGTRRGWGGSYGVGLSYDFSPRSSLVLEWSRFDVKFPGASGRDNLDMTSLGYQYRF